MTVCPATVHFRLYPYASFTEVTTLRDSNGDPVDLTGYTALMHIRREIEDEEPLFTLDSESMPAGIVLGGVDGTIELRLTNEQTATPSVQWDGEMWVHDLLLSAPSGDVERTYQGFITVTPAVTRPAP